MGNLRNLPMSRVPATVGRCRTKLAAASGLWCARARLLDRSSVETARSRV
jgi:hypothetical protein